MTYTEPSREISVISDVDVLVLGAGPAGIGAAVWAARTGANTMLIEQAGDVGGISTIGLMSHWTGNTKGGFYDEILNRSADSDYAAANFGFHVDKQIINPEHLKTVYLQILHEAGVRLRLYTFASDVIMEGTTIKGVILESKSGREAVMAKVVIDCTGDGDIAAKSGAAYYLGRETDGSMQPVTIMFKVGGVDYSKAIFPSSFEDQIEVPAGEIQSLGKQHLPFPAGHVLLYATSLPGVVTCNMTNCTKINGTDVDDLVKATLICREQMEPIVAFLRKYAPGYENCYLLSSASLIGVRENRHFKCVQTITEEDIQNARVFDNWVVSKAHFNFDVHNMTGNGLDQTGCQAHFQQKKGYTIPYGCFVPESIDGLLLAGRNISGTHMAHSNFRVMPICINMGQAVGIAAALAIHHKILPRDVDAKEIQQILIKHGVTL